MAAQDDLRRAADTPPPGWQRAMLTDIHFWIPIGVLIGGLLLLRWIAVP